MQISVNYFVNEFLFRFGNVTTRTEHLYFSRFSETEWGWRDYKCWWAQTLESQQAEDKKCSYTPWALFFPPKVYVHFTYIYLHIYIYIYIYMYIYVCKAYTYFLEKKLSPWLIGKLFNFGLLRFQCLCSPALMVSSPSLSFWKPWKIKMLSSGSNVPKFKKKLIYKIIHTNIYIHIYTAGRR